MVNSTKPIPQGIYDNTTTMCREVYHGTGPEGARLVQFITAHVILTKLEYSGLNGKVAPWGTYPDIPT